MTSPTNQVDEATIRQALAAFETAMADTNAAQQAVTAVSTSIAWTGKAAALYQAALTNWTTGLHTVQRGLLALESAMNTHLHVSSNAENETAQMARWYE